IFIITVAALLAGGCRFDDSALTERVDDFKNRLETLQGEIDKMNAQLKNLSEIASGNVIQSVLQDSDGNYVITYLDSKDQTRSVVIATASQMINVPVLGVELDEASNIYYWTVTTGSQTTLLLIDGEKVPVSGHTPVVSADAEGYWTVNGQRLTDGSGNPIKAADGQTCIFRSVEKTDDGNLSVVLGSGEVLTLPVQDAFNLTLTAVINTVVIDPSSPMKIGYGLTGAKASEALVGIACAQGIEASIDREAKEVTVTFPSAFTSGVLVMVAYDLSSHTVIRPVFFEKALSDRIDIYNAAELLQFASDVNAQNGTELMKAYLMDDIDFATVRASGWTPIGNAAYTTANVITGPTFKGIFDGQGHSIKNFNLAVPSDAPAGSAWGLFGVLENAEVKNVNFASSCSFTSEAKAMSALGSVAGYVYASTVSNCSSAAAFSFTGGSENLRTSIGGVVGAMCCTDAVDALVEGCSFSGSMTSTNTANTKNGGTGISIGGIAGFSDALGTPASGLCRIRDCVNNGTLDVQATRTAGIVATMNKYSRAENCTNNGAVTCSDTKASNSRVAGIVSGMGTSTSIAGCVNNGNITFCDT
ncbi:MAG: PL29 family lyase N-terminal domain-containing protein, partial [Candidatus Cryptobacteroides sp.]